MTLTLKTNSIDFERNGDMKLVFDEDLYLMERHYKNDKIMYSYFFGVVAIYVLLLILFAEAFIFSI